MFAFLQPEEFCRAGLMVLSFFNLFYLIWDIIISFFNMTDIFSGIVVRLAVVFLDLKYTIPNSASL